MDLFTYFINQWNNLNTFFTDLCKEITALTLHQGDFVLQIEMLTLKIKWAIEE